MKICPGCERIKVPSKNKKVKMCDECIQQEASIKCEMTLREFLKDVLEGVDPILDTGIIGALLWYKSSNGENAVVVDRAEGLHLNGVKNWYYVQIMSPLAKYFKGK